MSETLMEAERLPVAAGVKMTLMVQLALAATEVPQLLVWAKSAAFAPVSEIAVMERGALPVLDSVNACAPLAAPTA